MKKQGKILVVDDNRNILSSLRLLLDDVFEDVMTLPSPKTMLNVLAHGVDAVLLDMNFVAGINNGNEGLYWLHKINDKFPDVPVVLFTAYADVELAVQAMKDGAFDFVEKPWDDARLIDTLMRAVKSRLGSAPANPAPTEMVWGQSEAMLRLKTLVEKVARTDANVLITGENGTGKDVLTHEIMNSIAPINALSDSLLPTASGTMKEKIEVIRDTSASLMAFTETFRKFSAIPKPQRQLVYVADLISEATTLLSESIANASVKIHTENDLIVNADRTLMVRALVNLLHNAVDAGATKIDICSRSCSDDSVVIDISDNGSPIPEECRDRIFVPFFTTKQNGSGIGLAVARRVLSLHDGGISLIQPTDAPYTKTFRMSLL